MKKAIIINAIVWASIILIGSYFFKDLASNQYFLMIPLLGYFATNTFITRKMKKKACS